MSTPLGRVLTDGNGHTLYLFAADRGTASRVPSGILGAWPPLIASGTPSVGPGLDPGKLGTALQANGQTWVTFNGHPLYTYRADTRPGDIKGEGLTGVWFVVSPQGNRIAS